MYKGFKYSEGRMITDPSTGQRVRVLQATRVCDKNFYYLEANGDRVWKEEKELEPLKKVDLLESLFAKTTNSIDFGKVQNTTIEASKIVGGTLTMPKQEVLSGIQIHNTLNTLERQMKNLTEDIRRIHHAESAKVLENEVNRLKSKYDRIVQTMNSFSIALVD